MDDRMRILSMVPGLRDLAPESLSALAHWFDTKTYEDELLCQESDPSDRLWVLAAGCIQVVKDTPSGPFLVAELAPTSLIGHGGAMNLTVRTATLRAKGPVSVLELGAEAAHQMLETAEPAVASPFRRALIVAMAQQLATATRTIGRLTAEGAAAADAEARLLRAGDAG